MPILLQPIGVIHTPFTDPTQTPIQASRSTALGHVEVFPDSLRDCRTLRICRI